MSQRKNATRAGSRRGGTRKDAYASVLGHASIQESDLALTRQSMRNIPSQIPKQISSQIVYDVVRLSQPVTTALAAITEQNFATSLSAHPEVAQWAALFDQWCIPQYAVTFTSTEPPGSLGQSPVLTTAVDFDNTSALGSLTLLLEFENAQQVVLAPGVSHTRACRPCLKPLLPGGATGVDRMWCDSATPAAVWNGIRLIASATTVASTSINAQQTIWFAFRNGI